MLRKEYFKIRYCNIVNRNLSTRTYNISLTEDRSALVGIRTDGAAVNVAGAGLGGGETYMGVLVMVHGSS